MEVFSHSFPVTHFITKHCTFSFSPVTPSHFVVKFHTGKKSFPCGLYTGFSIISIIPLSSSASSRENGEWMNQGIDVGPSAAGLCWAPSGVYLILFDDESSILAIFLHAVTSHSFFPSIFLRFHKIRLASYVDLFPQIFEISSSLTKFWLLGLTWFVWG